MKVNMGRYWVRLLAVVIVLIMLITAAWISLDADRVDYEPTATLPTWTPTATPLPTIDAGFYILTATPKPLETAVPFLPTR